MNKLHHIILLLLFAVRSVIASDYVSNSEGTSFSWNSNDVVGIYTVAEKRIRCTMKELQSSPNNVILTGNGWGLNAQTLYYAYAPYSPDYVINGNHITALPITFTGQTQSANGSTAHLGQYDYMTAQTITGETDATFSFKHLGSIVRLSIAIPEEATVTSLSLSTEKAFVAEATMNITDNTLTPTENSTVATLVLDNIKIDEGGQLVAYMMMSPGDYSDSKWTLTVTDDSGKAATAYINGVSMEAGKTYPIEILGLSNFLEGNGEPETARQQNSKGVASPVLEEATESTVISYPYGYAPDFPMDKENKFEESILLGDADNDGRVTMADANLVVNNYLGTETPGISMIKADVNGDGVLTMADANGIVNIYLSK